MSDALSNGSPSAATIQPDCAARDRRLVTGTFLFCVLLYGATCAPGVLWQDSAMFQHRVWFFDLRGESGLPLAHPLYILLAKAFTALWPFGDFAWRVNLFSALCSAVAAAVAMRLLLNLTRCALAGVVGVLSLVLSHTFWTHAVIAEVYNLYALGLLVELWSIERFVTTKRAGWLAWALFFCGLNLSNHVLALLHGPAYLLLVGWAVRKRILSIRQFGLAVGAFLIGTLPYSWLIAGNIADGQTVLDALREAVVGPAERSNKVLAVSFSFGGQIARAIQYFAMNFPTPIVLAAPLGLMWLGRDTGKRMIAVFAATVFLVDFVFAFRYPVPDQFVFYTPCYVILAICVGLGIHAVHGRLKHRFAKATVWVLAALPVLVYAAAPAAIKSLNMSIGSSRDIHFRDTLRYFIQPWKGGETSAQRFADSALNQAAPDGLLYADTTIKNVLVYVRDVQGKHRGVTLTTGHDTIPLPPRIDRTPQDVEPFVQAGKAFICSNVEAYVPPWVRERWDLEPAGIIFKIVPRKGAR